MSSTEPRDLLERPRRVPRPSGGREPETDARERDTHLLETPRAGPAAIRGGAIRVSGFGAGVAMTTLSAALLFRHLGVDDGGRYVTVLAIVSIVAGLTDAGLTGIGMRELVVRHPSEREPLLRNLLGMRIVLGAVGLAGAVAFAALAGYGSAMVLGTALAGFGTVLQTFQNTLAVRLMVDLRLGWVTVAELLRQLVTVVGIVVLVLAGASLVPFLALAIPASLAAVGLTVWLVRNEVPLRPGFDWGEWRLLIRDVLPFAAVVLVSLIYFRVALIVLSLVSSARETGFFGASFRVTEVLMSVPQLLVVTPSRSSCGRRATTPSASPTASAECSTRCSSSAWRLRSCSCSAPHSSSTWSPGPPSARPPR